MIPDKLVLVMHALAIDFETANSSRSSPCAVGLAWIENGAIAASGYHLIRPKVPDFGFYETRIHGITAKDVQDSPEFPEVFAHIRPYLASHVLLCHGSAFDVSVLIATAKSYGLALEPFDVLCTLQLARRLWPGRGGHSLSHIAQYLDVSFQHHYAEDDALMSARIAVHAAQQFGARGIRDAAKRAGITISHRDPGSEPDERDRRTNARRDVGLTDLICFEVSGRSGTPYQVTSSFRNGALDVRCSCIAGRNRKLCHHLRELMDGCVDTLTSRNEEQVGEFARRCRDAGGLDALFTR